MCACEREERIRQINRERRERESDKEKEKEKEKGDEEKLCFRKLHCARP